MKQFKSIFFVIVLSLIFGCGAQKFDTDNPETSILGHWESTDINDKQVSFYVKNVEFDFFDDGNFNAMATLKDGSQKKQSGSYSIDYKEITLKSGGHDKAGRYTVSGDTISFFNPELKTDITLKKVS